READRKRGGLSEGAIAPRSHAVLDHQRSEGGNARDRRHRSRQHHGWLERLFYGPCAFKIFSPLSKDSTAPERSAEPSQPARKSNRYDDRICLQRFIRHSISKAGSTSFHSRGIKRLYQEVWSSNARQS